MVCLRKTVDLDFYILLAFESAQLIVKVFIGICNVNLF